MQKVRIIRYLFSLILLILFRQTVVAQQYPVTASTQIIPPYSVYLPDYVVPGSDKMRVILVQNDLTRPSYDVVLRMTIEQNGVVIMRTSPRFVARPLTLSAGVPTIISGADLTDYLNSDNIDFTGGFSRDAYEKNKSLPEGAYRITFTAFDFRRPTIQISNVGANVFYFRKNDPPLLNLPVCGSRVEKKDPQFLSFSWSSRTTLSPVEGSATEYVFSLYEIKPKGSNADYIIRSARPIYTVTTENTSIVYGPAEPALIDSMEYAWIVQARDKSGRDAYSNQGYSQSCKFLYQGNNPFDAYNIAKPTLYGKGMGERSIRLSWPLATGTARYNVDAYRVEYRASAQGGVDFDWHSEEKQADTVLSLHSLEPGRTYEARLQWRVAGVYGPFSEIVKVTTDALRTFNCGEMASLQLPQNSQPIPSLSAGMIVRVGHFDVLLKEVSGGDGTFSGTGKIITTGFGAGLLLEFRKVFVNSDMVVIRGEMQAATDGIDKFTEDALKEQRGGNDAGQVKTGDIIPDITTNLHIFTKDNIKVDPDKGTITLTDSQTGKQEVIDYKSKGKTLPMVIEDTDGNLYNVDKDGKVTSAGKRDKGLAGNATALAALNILDLTKGSVIFSPGTSNKYAFDSWKPSYYGKKVLEKSYESLADGAYRVSAKAIVPGKIEEVIATLTNGTDAINRDSIKFVSGKGIAFPFVRNGDKYTITVTGGPGNDAQEIFAVHAKAGKYVSLGKLLVSSYLPMEKKVVLVPVGANTAVPEDAIRNRLAEAYGKIGVNYTVQVDNSFRTDLSWDQDGDKVLQDGKSAFLGNGFTGEEKAMKKAYSKGRTIDKDATYLFVVDEVVLKDADLLGKMPRQSQFGFVFVKGASVAEIGRAVAHETGHGAYTLEHTFSGGIGIDQGTTDNLMDYKDGYSLLKYQWDVVHDPGNVWGLFEGDDAADLVGYADIKVFEKLKNTANNTYTFISPAGNYITLPENAKNLKFSTLDRTFRTIDGTLQATNRLVSLGALISFDINNISYEAYFDGDNFIGYGSPDKVIYKEKYSKDLLVNSGVGVFLGVKGGRFVTYASRFAVKQNISAVVGDYSGQGTYRKDFAVIDIEASFNEATLESILNSKKIADYPVLELPVETFNFHNQELPFEFENGKSTLKEFLQEVLSESSPLKDLVTFYTIANLKENELSAYKSCLGNRVWSRQFLESFRNLKYTFKDPSGNEFYKKAKDDVLTELAKLAVGDSKLVADLHKAVQANMDAADIHKILVANYAKCALVGIDIKDRIYILDQLLSAKEDNDNWFTDPSWFSTNDGEFILKDLINSTPASNRTELLKNGFMRNNNQWLRTLWKETMNQFNGVGYEDLHSVFDILATWLQTDYAALKVPITSRSYQTYVTGFNKVTYYPAQQIMLLGPQAGEAYDINGISYEAKFGLKMNAGDPVSVDLNDNTAVDFKETGKIRFYQNYTWKGEKTALLPATQMDVTYDYDLDPFEPMSMLAVRNIHELGITAGDKMVLPSFMGMLYRNDLLRVQAVRDRREGINNLVMATYVASVILSDGASLSLLGQVNAFLAEASAAKSACDQLIQKEKNNISPQAYLLNKEGYDQWERISSAVDYANMAGLGVNLTVWGASHALNKLGNAEPLLNTYYEFQKTIAPVASASPELAIGMSRMRTIANGEAIVAAEKAAGINKLVVVLDQTQLGKVGSWIKAGEDNYAYIVLHGSGEEFSIMVNGVEKTFNHRSLGQWILGNPELSGKTIVLLSCSSLEAAQNLSRYTGINLVASEGSVRLYPNGAIVPSQEFVGITPRGSIESAPVIELSNVPAAGEEFVELGNSISTDVSGPSDINWDALKTKLYGFAGKDTKLQFKFDKLLARMKENTATSSKFAKQVIEGKCESIYNYQKVITNAIVNEQGMKASMQALDKAEELLANNHTAEYLMFEDNIPGQYDVDLGIRKAPGAMEYSVGYQFKSNTALLSKQTIYNACSQLEKAKVDFRIPELRLIPGDNLASIKNNEEITKALLNVLHFNIKSENNNNTIMNEVHLIFSDGEKIKVIYENNNLQYIKF
ncbi:hypothetical protein ACE38W_02725 [Chitinophaga sp. Hz27]|uniref:hypothetical protein n=1 Tax=Chitinophaga sp. Hz27 TaxID=3347169 RepID=UPI0035E2D9DC